MDSSEINTSDSDDNGDFDDEFSDDEMRDKMYFGEFNEYGEWVRNTINCYYRGAHGSMRF